MKTKTLTLEEAKNIAREAWIESFFLKRNTDITGFEDWFDKTYSKETKSVKYRIKRFIINKNKGTHHLKTIVADNIETEFDAIFILKRYRSDCLDKYGKNSFVTDISDWTFNVLASKSEGDRAIINFSIETY